MGRNGYDRTRVLEAATRARSRQQHRKAIRLYRWVLAHEPRNPELHLKLAPILAEAGHRFDAWVSFRTAARTFLAEDRVDKALDVYREACDCLPDELDCWLEMAELQRRRRREADALQLLMEARLQFRVRWRRPEAAHILRRVLRLVPWHVAASIDLARILAHLDQRQEALLILDRLARHCEAVDLRRVRRARFRISKRLRDGWAWLRTSTPKPDPLSQVSSASP